jgi:hypothetical protein
VRARPEALGVGGGAVLVGAPEVALGAGGGLVDVAVGGTNGEAVLPGVTEAATLPRVGCSVVVGRGVLTTPPAIRVPSTLVATALTVAAVSGASSNGPQAARHNPTEARRKELRMDPF